MPVALSPLALQTQFQAPAPAYPTFCAFGSVSVVHKCACTDSNRSEGGFPALPYSHNAHHASKTFLRAIHWALLEISRFPLVCDTQSVDSKWLLPARIAHRTSQGFRRWSWAKD